MCNEIEQDRRFARIDIIRRSSRLMLLPKIAGEPIYLEAVTLEGARREAKGLGGGKLCIDLREMGVDYDFVTIETIGPSSQFLLLPRAVGTEPIVLQSTTLQGAQLEAQRLGGGKLCIALEDV